jgi:small subunit ribosomal protein S5
MSKKGDSQKKEKVESDIIEKVLYINRCSKVVKGGRKFSFSALILVGDGKGRVGFGIAKANELTDAIRKGGESARKNMKHVVMEGTTVPHEIRVDWDGASVLIKPAPAGSGVVAGSKVRAVLELAGYKDVMAKNLGSSNPINQVRATFRALFKMRTRETIKQMRGTA